MICHARDVVGVRFANDDNLEGDLVSAQPSWRKQEASFTKSRIAVQGQSVYKASKVEEGNIEDRLTLEHSDVDEVKDPRWL